MNLKANRFPEVAGSPEVPETARFPERPRGRRFARALTRGLECVLLGSALFLLPLSATAQETGAGRPASNAFRGILYQWLQDQNQRMRAVDSFSIEADVRHQVETRDGIKEALYGLTFRRLEDEERGQGDLRYFILDGDTLNVSERRRVERTISSMMTPELGPLLNGLNLPVAMLSRGRQLEAPVEVEREGRTLVRFFLTLERPLEDQRLGPPGGRPGARPGARPGMRPGAQRPPGGMRQPSNNFREGSPPRIMAFFDAQTGHLVAIHIRLELPGDRSLVAQTRFQRTDGIDVPLTRSVSGTFPLQRRLRTVTVTLDHHTRFSNVSLNFRD